MPLLIKNVISLHLIIKYMTIEPCDYRILAFRMTNLIKKNYEYYPYKMQSFRNLLPVTIYRVEISCNILPVTIYRVEISRNIQLQYTGWKYPVTYFHLQYTGCKYPVTYFQLQYTGCKYPVTSSYNIQGVNIL